MSYAVRNTLILGILLLMVVSVILYMNISKARELKILNKAYQEKNTNLINIINANPDYKDIDRLIREFEQMKQQQRESGKIIPKSNTPADTYSYLLNICERYAQAMKFDFELIMAEATSEEHPNIKHNVYSVEGVSNINTVYTFLYHLENQVMFYIIDNLTLTEEQVSEQLEDGKTKTVSRISFKLTLNAYYDETSEDENLPPNRRLTFSKLRYNPFYSRIHEPNYKPEEEVYINISTVKLIGLTPEKVFLRDSAENIITVNIGDKVAYGYLDRIEWENQAAVFKLNETGIYKEKILLLDKE